MGTERKHSPEPWVRTGEGLAVVAADGRKVVSPLPHPERTQTAETREANLDRIVACVNACRGIPTEQLEAGGPAAALDAERRAVAGLLKDRAARLRELARGVEDPACGAFIYTAAELEERAADILARGGPAGEGKGT